MERNSTAQLKKMEIELQNVHEEQALGEIIK